MKTEGQDLQKGILAFVYVAEEAAGDAGKAKLDDLAGIDLFCRILLQSRLVFAVAFESQGGDFFYVRFFPSIQ